MSRIKTSKEGDTLMLGLVITLFWVIIRGETYGRISGRQVPHYNH